MYLDTSVLVKLLVREWDTEFWGRVVDGHPLCSSWLASTEVLSALLAQERSGQLDSGRRAAAWDRFGEFQRNQSLELVSPSEVILRRAGRLIERVHPLVPLRTLDAMHLATADQRQDWPLVTNDRRMRDAARLLGYPITDEPAPALIAAPAVASPGLRSSPRRSK